MSTNFKIVAGLLGCLALAFLWFGRGTEPPPPSAPAELDETSNPAFNKPNRQMLLNQPEGRDHLGDTESHRSEIVKDHLNAHSQKVKERRLAMKERKGKPTPNEAEQEEDFAHLRDVALNDPDPDERADALTQLDYDEPDAMAVLVQALQDKDSDVRLSALDELWVSADEPPLDILAPVLDDPDPEVRAEAVRMIGESEEPRAAELLSSALGDPDEDVRSEAADALDVDDDQL